MSFGQGDPDRSFFPYWFHKHGNKMHVESIDLQNPTIVISGSAAKVIVKKASLLHSYSDISGWIVDWEVIHCVPFGEEAHGRVHFDDDKWLEVAFGLSDDPGDASSRSFAQFFLAEFGKQGKYIRHKNFLNIPGPGTSHDGDPNISIFITDEIRQAIRQLLAH